MNINLNYKSSDKRSTTTEQELFLRQRLSQEEVPFTFQQEFHLKDRWYIIDFFIANTILLECSSTSMVRHNAALKQKALQLELKCSQLKKWFSFPIWVLFESQRPIGSSLITTLTRLMPSVDYFLTSSAKLIEDLRGLISNCEGKNRMKSVSSSNFCIYEQENFFDQKQTLSESDNHSFIALNHISALSKSFISSMVTLQSLSCLLPINKNSVNYSRNMNLNSIEQKEENL